MPNMIPPKIIAAAKQHNINGIAVTDHNSAGNVKAVVAAARDQVTVFGGMEITTQEEIHLLTLFPDGEQLYLLEDLVSKNNLVTLIHKNTTYSI